jgi:mercuric ion transport protein
MTRPAQPPFRSAIAAAVLSAIAASVCCVVPLVLVLLGISGAWIGQLTALDVWRPWWTAATLVCLALAYWSLWKAGKSCESPACAEASILRRRRRGLAIVAALIALLLLFPYYARWIV